MSQGAEKSQPLKVGIEPGPLDLRANKQVTVKASFYGKAVEACYIPKPTTYSPALNRFIPEFARNHAVILVHFHLGA